MVGFSGYFSEIHDCVPEVGLVIAMGKIDNNLYKTSDHFVFSGDI